MTDQFRHKATKKAVTLRQVAEVAGVSASAASMILNGATSGTRVSESTRQAVTEVARRMGYRPNKLAQSLATGTTGRIGFYSGRSRLDCRNLFYAEILSGIFDGAEQHGLDTIIHTAGNERAKILDLVNSQALDGLLLHVNPEDPIIPLLGELLVPAVSIGDQIEGLPSVVVDDQRGGSLLAQHLAEKGHRSVLAKQSASMPSSAVARIEAFCRQCLALGLEAEVSFATPDGGGLGEADVQAISRASKPVTAIMCWSDAMAMSTIKALSEAGYSVPSNVAVVGFDGFEQMSVTSISAPWFRVAQEAVGILQKLINKESVPFRTVLPVEFRSGSTT